ncbi:MAG: outer membrane beta-barrel protein [Bacteroidota bacterium]
MSEHPLDRIFRERLASRKAGPTDHLWAGIAAKQRAIRLRRRLMYAVAILAALCILIAGFFMVKGSVAIPTEDAPTIEQGPVSTETPRSAPLAQHIDVSSSSTNDKSSLSDDRRSASTSLASAGREVQIDNTTTTLAEQSSNLSPSLSLPQSQIPSQNFKPTPTTLSPPTPRENLQDLTAAANALDEDKYAQNKIIESDLQDIELVESGYELSLRDDLFESAGRLSRSKSDRMLIGEDYVFSTKAEHAIKPTRLKNRFELELTVGPAYSNQILKASSELFREDLDAREISEFPHLSYSGVVRLKYRLANGFSLTGGVGYTAIRNRLEYEMPVPNEDPELIERTNALRLIEIPLMLGYEFPGEKVKLGISAGPVVNLSTQADGAYLSAETQMPVGFEEGGVYDQNAGLAWRFNLSASYPLGRGGTRLLVEPTFSHYPRSFTQDSYPISERYWVAGLQVGIRKLLR